MSLSHHGDKPPQSELLKQFAEQLKGNATRKWPEGRLDGTDDGQLVYKVGSDPETGLVKIEFGKPVAWMAMSPQDAVNLAQSLIKHARSISKEPIRIVLN